LHATNNNIPRIKLLQYLVSNKDTEIAVRRNRADLFPLSDVQASQPLTTVERPTDTNDPVFSHSVPDAQTQSSAVAIPAEVNTNPDPAPVRWQKPQLNMNNMNYTRELYQINLTEGNQTVNS